MVKKAVYRISISLGLISMMLSPTTIEGISGWLVGGKEG